MHPLVHSLQSIPSVVTSLLTAHMIFLRLRALTRSTLGCCLHAPSFSLIVPESLSWLVASGRHKDAEKIIRRAARLNGLQLPDNFSLDELEDQQKTDGKKEHECESEGEGGREGQGGIEGEQDQGQELG